MSDEKRIEERFWKLLKSDRIVMLGIDGVDDGFARPMAAQVDKEQSPIWFFTSTENHIVDSLSEGRRAIATFAAKGELYASIRGSISLSHDQDMIEKLWNPKAMAWFDGGKEDPKLRLIRFDAENAEIWLDGSSLVAGVKSLLGIDPKKDYEDDQATVSL